MIPNRTRAVHVCWHSPVVKRTLLLLALLVSALVPNSARAQQEVYGFPALANGNATWAGLVKGSDGVLTTRSRHQVKGKCVCNGLRSNSQ